jgi:peptidoglycan/xylan/chitin deacetylase (PgdA/CDA1 family)
MYKLKTAGMSACKLPTMITILKRSCKPLVILSLLLPGGFPVNAQQNSFKWPNGIKAAISLSFDDARLSQVDVGTPLLDQYGVKATFVLVPSNVEKRLDKWKEAAANGHELGNHTLYHPCSGNFSWSKEKALENYTLKKMRAELVETNRQLEHLLGVKATVFAYPCGSTYVGRGINTKSYVPLIADLFVAGRGWLNETPNDPAFCDFAQLTGMEMDGKDFDQILPLIENSRKNGSWLVLAGHEIGQSGNQTTRVEMLKKLIAYAQDPANGIWIAPMGEIAGYVKEQRKISNGSRNE